MEPTNEKERQVTAGARALREYLRQHGLSVTKFCDVNGLDRIQVQRVLNGERTRISVDFARDIYRATGGEVEWVLWASDTLKSVAAEGEQLTSPTGTEG